MAIADSAGTTLTTLHTRLVSLSQRPPRQCLCLLSPCPFCCRHVHLAQRIEHVRVATPKLPRLLRDIEMDRSSEAWQYQPC